MRVIVDADICQGHALCSMTAPEVFDLREDDGHSEVKVDEVPPEAQEAARRAVEGCPERAISIVT